MSTDSPEKSPARKRIGRARNCDLVLTDDSVSRQHASVELTGEGYLSVQDDHSSNGTYLFRNEHWVRARKVILGSGDRIRFGEEEIDLDRLVALFGEESRVRLRDGWSVRGKPLVFRDFHDAPEKPRRNPLTGKIEEKAD